MPAGKYLAGIAVNKGQHTLTVWEWRAGKEAAKQTLQSPSCTLAWSDTTTLITAGEANLKACLYLKGLRDPFSTSRRCPCIGCILTFNALTKVLLE